MSITCAVAPQTIELETTGHFVVEAAVDESSRCGTLGSPRRIAYKVVITSAPEHLDANGFIIDWQEIRNYFVETYRNVTVFPSCERIACQACTDIVERLGACCLALDVTIGSGERPAGMTARWVGPWAQPSN